MAIILIAIGLMFTGVDFFVTPGIAYPEFVAPKGPVGGFTIHAKIQEYVTQNILGGQLQLDILPDVVGCIFIIIGTLLLIKHNKNYFKELNMYIIAGKQKIEEVRTKELPALMEKASRTGLSEDAQEVNDTKAMLDRFEKKIHDLELTKAISLQMAPQIRLIQNNDTVMAEKIQSTLVNTIPLWKSQMVLALGMNRSVEAARAQQAVTDVTNELLRKNAAVLQQSTIETAKASEKSIVDIETLTETNQMLIATLDEVLKIQTEGKEKRRLAEIELNRIENDLKNRLLEMRQ